MKFIISLNVPWDCDTELQIIRLAKPSAPLALTWKCYVSATQRTAVNGF
jgi:hypothetical protein